MTNAPTRLDDPTPHRTRRAKVVAAIAGVVLLAGTAYAVVHGIDASALAQTRVFLDARSLTCADPDEATTLTRGRSSGSEDETYAVPAVRGAKDLDCRLSVVVQNDPDRDLEVDRVTLTLLGPQSRVGLHTDYAFAQGLEPFPGGDRDDVVNDPDNRSPYTVRAAGVERFDFHLVSDGCRQAGASTTWPGSPTCTATIGTATEALPLSGAGFGFIGAKTTNQPCTWSPTAIGRPWPSGALDLGRQSRACSCDAVSRPAGAAKRADRDRHLKHRGSLSRACSKPDERRHPQNRRLERRAEVDESTRTRCPTLRWWDVEEQ